MPTSQQRQQALCSAPTALQDGHRLAGNHLSVVWNTAQIETLAFKSEFVKMWARRTLAQYLRSPRFNPQYCLNQVQWLMPAAPALRRYDQDIRSSRSTSATQQAGGQLQKQKTAKKDETFQQLKTKPGRCYLHKEERKEKKEGDRKEGREGGKDGGRKERREEREGGNKPFFNHWGGVGPLSYFSVAVTQK